MREPLRSVNAFAELLKETAEERLGAEGDEILREIFSGAARMRLLLEGVAGYSSALRAEGGAGEGGPKTSVKSALKILVNSLDEQMRACGATVTSEDLPKVSIDLERLMQLLENLLGNALRFRAEDPPVIRVTATAQDGGMWAIRVEDNGIGVAPEFHEAVFKPFMRVEGRKYGGVGLGLTVSRKIVEAHGGAIRMENAPGRGAAVEFTLPGE